jgi:hypothetical protein
MGLITSTSKVQRAIEALASSARDGCWACGTGTGHALCNDHQRRLVDTARTEGRRPLTREELGGRGW